MWGSRRLELTDNEWKENVFLASVVKLVKKKNILIRFNMINFAILFYLHLLNTWNTTITAQHLYLVLIVCLFLIVWSRRFSTICQHCSGTNKWECIQRHKKRTSCHFRSKQEQTLLLFLWLCGRENRNKLQVPLEILQKTKELLKLKELTYAAENPANLFIGV